MLTLSEALHGKAAEPPGSTALIYMGARITHGELDRSHLRTSRALAAAGMKPG